MANNGLKKVEDIIIHAIGHSERRGIIRIIGVNPEGVTYSSILGETEARKECGNELASI